MPRPYRPGPRRSGGPRPRTGPGSGPPPRRRFDQPRPEPNGAGAVTAVHEPSHAPRQVVIPQQLSVKDLAGLLNVSVIEVIKQLMKNGVWATVNQELDHDTATIVAGELGFEVRGPETERPAEVETGEVAEAPAPVKRSLIQGESEADLQPRPPVVTVMGHVDHGKTSLLDAIRQTNVTAGEAGGITQHIGAYQVEKNGHLITFLDTPGHEAFTAMRARGAMVTDIAIIVVAADDGVMPQTIEAINHAKSAGVDIMVAINKIDRVEANVERVKQQLAQVGLLVEGYGGEVVAVPVSARTKEGIDDLLDLILTVAELGNYRANPNRPAVGTIIEAQMDRQGPVATVLVANGTLRVGDTVLVGHILGKVRAMFDDKGRRIKSAGPAFPAKVMGLDEVPTAGDLLEVFTDERAARALAEQRKLERKSAEAQPRRALGLDEIFAQFQAGQTKELNLIVKADTKGSVEAIHHSLERLGDENLRVRIIHEGIGAVSESDVLLAVAAKAQIIGFHVRTDPAARRVAETEGVSIRHYEIIYNLVDDVTAALKGMLEPVFKEEVQGRAEVRRVFKVSRGDAIAGSYVLEGTITRNAQARVKRGNQVLYTGRVGSLRRFKDDVRDVNAGFECGIGIDGFSGYEEGDIIETFAMVQV